MKNNLILTAFILICSGLMAQGEYDAMKYSQTDITGSARYVSMSGAFGALGGDISSVGLNPAGIAVYRSSELTFTPFFTKTETNANLAGSEAFDSNINFNLNNVGYVGSFRTNSNTGISNFNFGISYNRLKDYNRNMAIYGDERNSSLLDRVCQTLGNNVDPTKLVDLGFLSYENYLINREADGRYTSVLQDGEKMNSDLYFQERGGIDEWNFSLGANWAHFLYVGVSVNFQHLKYELMSDYRERSSSDDLFSFQLNNAMITDGRGVNAKLGAIIRPITNLRFGFAMHSPTYYYLTDTYGASMSSTGILDEKGNTDHFARVDEGYTNYQLVTPSRLVYSLAYQFGSKGLISMDWDLVDYRESALKSQNGVPYVDTNNDIKYRARDTKNFRLGGEYRLNDNVSLRAGTAWYQSSYEKDAKNKNEEFYTAGTAPYYSFDGGTRYASLGIGYRTGSFFFDVALIEQNSAESFFNFFDSAAHSQKKYADVDTKKTNVNVSLGFRF